ncbi:transcriptional repressor [bacterium]|nr:transcriptional repressor [bacterium]MBU1883066.1 transcriptional repressor [bacterium]
MKTKQAIEEKKFKLTSARKELLAILNKAEKPISYEDIKNRLSMDKATFYRNISKFEEENIVKSFESNDKKRYYEVQISSHAHFICNTCNKIECLSNISPIELKGYNITDMIFKGVCKNCS